ncbi:MULTISPECIES: HlyD family efflux transporter periplasmic adaptor subunit [Cyanophyceae]|uniref:HlyD family efflux transporter periplasmic adaptor subunit n=1 Tax=Cyanophyceae TaxID=3028117 RepID=UPI00232C368A|nr:MULTISPECIES: HlyD family efflux transporter periplasmic adaptor subunit [Cyanophyceae]MDB9358565.1 HlyD family efflux transporter periplasmic adaptor subunit [Nodularia spumigena CS-587/03]MDB9304257.1 HlyD family efflux transporter periplasmic adaptor subunit [Nodularia spumigena CS-591/12]MDB9339651.1 HlyD family efflux transporter periplasmic adaptor subunit [Nodularia spumigena CS-589/07]MDB9342446.1 HlyD family efflux transporter periplasmic adaptor subunit [Nodularia spumigena CS-588/
MTNTIPNFLPTAKSDEYLPSISIWTRLGGLFLVSFVGAAIMIAALTKYQQTVKASANVRPTGEVRIVQSAIAGTVKKISVKETQVVQQGDVLVILDDTQLQTQTSQLQGNIQKYQLQLAQLDAQIQALNRQIYTEIERNQRIITSALAELERTQRDYQDRKVAVNSEWEEAQANIKISEKELLQVKSDLNSIQANLASAEAGLEAAIIKRLRYEDIAKSGSISQNQLEEVQLAATQQAQIVESQKASLESQKQVIQQRQQALNSVIARSKKADSSLSPSNAVIAIAEEKVATERANGETNLARLQQEKESLIQRQIEIKDQINNTEKEVQQVLIQIEKTIIRASATGTILQLDLRNPGQVVSSGGSIAQIAPSQTPLIIKARVAPADISKVFICDYPEVGNCQKGRVKMRFSAYPYPDYGIMRGAVRTITADAISSQNNMTIEPYYEVTIEPEKVYLQRDLQQYPIQAGMEVMADIIAQEESVLTFILRKTRLITSL